MASDDAGLGALARGDGSALAEAQASLREIRISQQSGRKRVGNAELSAAEVELEIRKLLQTAASGDELLTFLRRRDVLGAAVPDNFPADPPPSGTRGGLKRHSDGQRRSCSISVKDELPFCSAGMPEVRHVNDLVPLKGSVELSFSHLLLEMLFDSFRSAAENKDVALQRAVAVALLDMLTEARSGNGEAPACGVPALSPPSLCHLMNAVMCGSRCAPACLPAPGTACASSTGTYLSVDRPDVTAELELQHETKSTERVKQLRDTQNATRRPDGRTFMNLRAMNE